MRVVVYDGAQLLPIGLRIDGPYGKALPLEPEFLSPCAAALGLALHRGLWWKTMLPMIEDLTALSYWRVRRASRESAWGEEPPGDVTVAELLDKARLLEAALFSGREASELSEAETAAWGSIMLLKDLVEQVSLENGAHGGLASTLASADLDTMDLTSRSEAGDIFKAIFGLSMVAGDTSVRS